MWKHFEDHLLNLVEEGHLNLYFHGSPSTIAIHRNCFKWVIWVQFSISLKIIYCQFNSWSIFPVAGILTFQFPGLGSYLMQVTVFYWYKRIVALYTTATAPSIWYFIQLVPIFRYYRSTLFNFVSRQRPSCALLFE